MAAALQDVKVVLLQFQSKEDAQGVLDRQGEISELFGKTNAKTFADYLTSGTDVENGKIELTFPSISAKRIVDVLVRFLQGQNIVVKAGTLMASHHVRRVSF